MIAIINSKLPVFTNIFTFYPFDKEQWY